MSENQTAKADHVDQSPVENAAQSPVDTFDAIVVGAGFSGLYLLHPLRTMGLSVR